MALDAAEDDDNDEEDDDDEGKGEEVGSGASPVNPHGVLLFSTGFFFRFARCSGSDDSAPRYLPVAKITLTLGSSSAAQS